jgi:hypothetical protein
MALIVGSSCIGVPWRWLSLDRRNSRVASIRPPLDTVSIGGNGPKNGQQIVNNRICGIGKGGRERPPCPVFRTTLSALKTGIPFGKPSVKDFDGIIVKWTASVGGPPGFA